MQLSDSLEVGIGLSFIFFIASLVLASIHEMLETVLKARGRNLYAGVIELLRDPKIADSGEAAVGALYEHPLIRGLMRGDVSQADFRRNLPSYLPTQSFSAALIDQAMRGKFSVPGTRATLPAALPEVARLRMAAEGIENEQLRKGLIHAIDAARGDVDAVRVNLEAWFDSAMDRVSGWYKRRSQRIVFALGITMALVLNVNTVTIAQSLYTSASLRQALTTLSEQRARACTADKACDDKALGGAAVRDLAASDVPVGWTDEAIAALRAPITSPSWGWWLFGVLQVIAGYLLTAFAVTLGAPFWFDVLNRLMVIRATVKPAEKSQPEAPQDPQPSKAGTLAVDLVEHRAPAVDKTAPDKGRGAPSAIAPIDADIHAGDPTGADRLFEDDEGRPVAGVMAGEGDLP